MPFEPASDVLSPYTVLDLTRVRSGPTCVRQLADWGANVIKIEDPGVRQGGGWAARAPAPTSRTCTATSASITLNLKIQTGHRNLPAARRQRRRHRRELPPRREEAPRHRLRDASRQINPRIIYVSISGFGQDGPLCQRPGFDQIAQGMGGLMSITGEPGKGPMRVGIPMADLCAGIFCAQASCWR